MRPPASNKGAQLAGLTFLLAASGWTQAPCTDASVRLRPGALKLDRREQAERDSRMRSRPDPAVLRKIDRTVALFQQALPDFQGLEGHYWHEIFDRAPNGHVWRFAIHSAFFEYYCAPAQSSSATRQVRLGDETGTWIQFYFNSLGDFVNERLSLGEEMRRAFGRAIFLLPKDGGEWKGQRVFLPEIAGETSEAIILAAPSRFPFQPVSREEFLLAREKVQETYFEDARAKLGPDSPSTKERQREVEAIRGLRASMNTSELRSQAVVLEWSGEPRFGRIFADEAHNGRRLVTIDSSYIDRSLPPSAVQLITVFWRWGDREPAKRELIRQFKNRFDIAALAKLVDR